MERVGPDPGQARRVQQAVHQLPGHRLIGEAVTIEIAIGSDLQVAAHQRLKESFAFALNVQIQVVQAEYQIVGHQTMLHHTMNVKMIRVCIE